MKEKSKETEPIKESAATKRDDWAVELTKRLREERKRQNLDLEEIGKELCLSPRKIKRFESDPEYLRVNYPNDLYLRGHVKSYAKRLELDVTRLLAQGITTAAPVDLCSDKISRKKKSMKVSPVTILLVLVVFSGGLSLYHWRFSKGSLDSDIVPNAKLKTQENPDIPMAPATLAKLPEVPDSVSSPSQRERNNTSGSEDVKGDSGLNESASESE